MRNACFNVHDGPIDLLACVRAMIVVKSLTHSILGCTGFDVWAYLHVLPQTLHK